MAARYLIQVSCGAAEVEAGLAGNESTSAEMGLDDWKQVSYGSAEVEAGTAEFCDR